MSFFDETKNAGIILFVIALLEIIFSVIVVFAFDDYKNADMWKKIVLIVGSLLGAAIYAVIGLGIMNGKCMFQIGNLFSDVTSKFGVLVALTACFGVTSVVTNLFATIAFGFGNVGGIVIGILFIVMAWLLVDGQEEARKVVWIILLVLYIIMLIVSIIAAFFLIGIPDLLLAIFLLTFMLSPEVKEKCGM